MMTVRISGSLLVASILLVTTSESQSLKPSKLMEPPTDTWPMYNGDYSGRRFSTLNKINDSNIRSLSLAWAYRTNVGGGGFGGSIKATPLFIDGVLYFTLPDHAWAIDARTGREVWHFTWESKGGIHIGSRGAAAYGNWLYFETPDCNLVSLSLKDGKKRWQTPICDLDQMYSARSHRL
jgi:alcohol dehydrogenase (cytochrome c)